MSYPHWSIAIYDGNGAQVAAPTFASEQEARKAFYNPTSFDGEAALPDSYAAVLWEMRDEGQASAVLSKVVSLPVEAPETWSPGF
jgi:hypothetical protein